MGHHVADVNLARPIVDVCGQAVLVAANVEDRELANGIRVRISSAHIHETGPPQSFRRPIPVIERGFGVLVSVGEIPKCPPAYDVHAMLYSQNESAVVKGQDRRVSGRQLLF